MALANVTTWGDIINVKVHNHISIVYHQQMTLYAFKIEIVDHLGVKTWIKYHNIKEKMNCQILLCLEHYYDHSINYLQKYIKKHTLPQDILDGVELN